MPIKEQIYELEELTDATELLREGPPWWLHVCLITLIIVMVSTVLAIATFAVIIKSGGWPKWQFSLILTEVDSV